MTDRMVPYDANWKCEVCGKAGCYDFGGDVICLDCWIAASEDDEEDCE